MKSLESAQWHEDSEARSLPAPGMSAIQKLNCGAVRFNGLGCIVGTALAALNKLLIDQTPQSCDSREAALDSVTRPVMHPESMQSAEITSQKRASGKSRTSSTPKPRRKAISGHSLASLTPRRCRAEVRHLRIRDWPILAITSFIIHDPDGPEYRLANACT
jgi:hypothetical protein